MSGGDRYVELQVTSHFSFLRGASSCEELFATASLMGMEALAVVDRNSVAGIVRAHEAAKTTGVRAIVGCRLDLVDALPILVYPVDRPAYARLCCLMAAEMPDRMNDVRKQAYDQGVGHDVLMKMTDMISARCANAFRLLEADPRPAPDIRDRTERRKFEP